jgi:hypothetical protein
VDGARGRYGPHVRSALPVTVVAAIIAGSSGAACAAVISQASAAPGPSTGTGTSGTGTVGPGTTVTPGPGTGSSGLTGPPRGTPAEQTHATVTPASGRAFTRFTVRLTLADTPGHSGVFATDYRLQLAAPRKAPAVRCAPKTRPGNIDSGTAGEVLRIPLTAPAAGWCAGRYQVTIFLERGPYCPQTTPGEPPPPCPEFATQELDVGDTHYTVKPPNHKHRAASAPRAVNRRDR